jgi:hypothetical protein
MAYVLSLRPHSPLKRSFSDNPYLQPYSPLQDPLLGPLSNITGRNTSACSLYSLGSNRVGSWTRGNENTPPLTSHTLLNFVQENSDALSVVHADHGPRKRSCSVDCPLPAISLVAAPSNPYSRKSREAQRIPEILSSSESSDGIMDVEDRTVQESDIVGLYEAIHVPLSEGISFDKVANKSHVVWEQLPPAAVDNSQPFRRWLSTLRRRHIHRQNDHVSGILRSSFDTENQSGLVLPPSLRFQKPLRRNSESMASSMGCITTVKSASMTVASTSIAPRSDAGLQGIGRVGNRSSHYSDARRSFDSHRGPLGPIIDESAWLRSLQRRKVVEELIASEEGYIADLKVLINVRLCLHRACMKLTFFRTIS